MSTAAAAATRPQTRAVACSRQWPGAIWAALVGTFLIRAAGFAYPFLAYYLGGLRLSRALVGAILAAFGFGWLAGQILSGWLADRIGRRFTLVATMTTAALTLPLLAQAHTAVSLLAATTLAGATYDAPRPVISALICDVIPDEATRAAVAGWRHFAVNAGAALTGAAGGFLTDLVGVRVLFWVNAVACALFALAAARFVEAGRPAPLPARADVAGGEAWRDARLWLLCLASLAGLTCAVGQFSSLPLLMAVRGLSATAYGWTQAVNAVVVIVLSPVITPWLSRRATATHPLLGALAAGSLVLGVGMGAAGLATTPVGFAAAVAVAVPGELVIFIAAAEIVNRIASLRRRPAACTRASGAPRWAAPSSSRRC
ncbi:MFS transporter [Streptomyces lydicus]|uniref:MFS transporter n=1 Tax=Streptomyces lydicus TaxID=47763 RepID=UPI0036EA2543